ncbi:MAG: hypothetical protein NE334_07015 [Lentisphaeraceae bacterium]|nr:hypothetical protein [Lentisphaeraceae bacterium]
MFKAFTLCFSICLAAFTQKAADKKEEKKVDEDLIITSQHLDYDHANHQAIFSLNVKAINGETTLTSDKMTCYFNKDNDPYLIIAEGNVIITRGDHIATCNKSTYKINEKEIILRSQPKLFDGNNTIKGRIITFYEDKRITLVADSDVILKAKLSDKKETEQKKDPKKN